VVQLQESDSYIINKPKNKTPHRAHHTVRNMYHAVSITQFTYYIIKHIVYIIFLRKFFSSRPQRQRKQQNSFDGELPKKSAI
jgi:hypothetical protein